MQYEISRMNNLFEYGFIQGAFAASQCKNIDGKLGWMMHKTGGQDGKNARARKRVGRRISGDITRDLILTIARHDTVPQLHMKTGEKKRGRYDGRGYNGRARACAMNGRMHDFEGSQQWSRQARRQILTGGWRYSLRFHGSVKMIYPLPPLPSSRSISNDIAFFSVA